jgi:hypothetical protein
MKLKRLKSGTLNITFNKSDFTYVRKGDWISDGHVLINTTDQNVSLALVGMEGIEHVDEDVYWDCGIISKTHIPDIPSLIALEPKAKEVVIPTNLIQIERNFADARVMKGFKEYIFVDEKYYEPFKDHSWSTIEGGNNPLFVRNGEILVAVIMPLLDRPSQFLKEI